MEIHTRVRVAAGKEPPQIATGVDSTFCRVHTGSKGAKEAAEERRIVRHEMNALSRNGHQKFPLVSF